MERHRIKRVPVLRTGKVVGIVSRANLLHGLVAQKTGGGKAAASDREIRSRILRELDKAGVDKVYVNLVVTSGEAEFWGFVESEAQKRALRVAAQNVKGVKRLNFDNAREFEPPSSGGAGGDYRGRNLHFGVREHAMCAVASGLCLSKLRPFAASFFIFPDYCRGAIRLSAMMSIPVIYIWSHDSISMGEDGPTHQPIEQLASFRAMPGMVLLRPADANEVVEAWKAIMRITDRPASLVLTLQALPTLDRSKYASASGVARGAYVLADAADGKPDVLLLATGSEVALCITAYEQLKREGIGARVVSMPSWDLFESQSLAYRDSVLPSAVAARVSVEAASTLGWECYVGPRGAIIGMRSFGLSAPGKVAEARFGFDAAHVVAAAKEQLARRAATK
jgi:transketolase